VRTPLFHSYSSLAVLASHRSTFRDGQVNRELTVKRVEAVPRRHIVSLRFVSSLPTLFERSAEILSMRTGLFKLSVDLL
jgi:hypothetical protein